MMKLAIKGNRRRGTEVIECLMEFGADNDDRQMGIAENCIYYVGDDNTIMCKTMNSEKNNAFKIYSIETYLQMNPYKRNDIVVVSGDRIGKISSMYWEDECVKYNIDLNDGGTLKDVAAHSLKLFSEDSCKFKPGFVVENKNTKIRYTVKRIDAFNEMYVCERWTSVSSDEVYIMWSDERMYEFVEMDIEYEIANDIKRDVVNLSDNSEKYADKVLIDFGEDFMMVNEDGKLYAVRKAKVMPNSYEEACKYLGIHEEYAHSSTYYYDEMEAFNKVRIAYIAFCKILKYVPNWQSNDVKYCIYIDEDDKVVISQVRTNKHYLVFPTAEVRDKFYNTFKEEIFTAKEFFV